MNPLLTVFIIGVLGYLLGSIKVKGLSLGTSGVLIVALLFGHYGMEIPSVIREFGLICFVTAVGFIAGPVFFRNFKSKALSYVVIGILIIIAGAGSCILVITLAGIPTPLAVGMMTGALTSTPGLAAAIDATGDSMASIGYGIAYPFGVIGVVLFVQLIPKLLSVDIPEEVRKLNHSMEKNVHHDISEKKHIELDEFGFFPFMIATIAGMIIGRIVIPLPAGASFTLGTSGGPLLAGLVMGHFMHVGPVSISVPKPTLETLREFGLVLFLMGAGTNAGKGFVEILAQYGVALFFLGALMTLLPMVIGYVLATRIFSMDILNSLGSICGGMTSTPALGTLLAVTKTEAVAASYAATYPVALIFVVLSAQFISIFLM
jgi:putative transport protein